MVSGLVGIGGYDISRMQVRHHTYVSALFSFLPSDEHPMRPVLLMVFDDVMKLERVHHLFRTDFLLLHPVQAVSALLRGFNFLEFLLYQSSFCCGEGVDVFLNSDSPFSFTVL